MSAVMGCGMQDAACCSTSCSVQEKKKRLFLSDLCSFVLGISSSQSILASRPVRKVCSIGNYAV